MKRLSLSETSRRFGISKGYLSRRVHAGKPAKGYDLHHYAAFSEDGKIDGFDLPEHMIPVEESPSQDEETGKRSGKEENNVSPASSDRGGDQVPLLEINSEAVRDVMGMERENPASSSEVAQSVAYGMAAKEGMDLIKSIGATFQDASPAETMSLLERTKDIAIEIAPYLTGGLFLYLNRDQSAVVQIAGALLSAAGADVILKGEKSKVARALRGEAPKTVGNQQERGLGGDGRREQAVSDVADEFGRKAAGDGVAVDVEPGINGALDRRGSDTQKLENND